MNLLKYLFYTLLLNFFVVESKKNRLNKKYPASCGRSLSHVKGRIIGGSRADMGEYPWIVSMQDDIKGHYCAASVINKIYLLTAAHCFRSPLGFTRDKNFYRLVFGVVDRLSETRLERRIRNFYIHEKFDIVYLMYDVALIQMDKRIIFSKSSVRPICLPPATEKNKQYYSQFWVAGWGRTELDGDTVQHLRHVKLKRMRQKKCLHVAAIRGPKLKNILCTESAGEKDTCQGDSGGPVMGMRKDNQRMYLRGLVSWGEIRCGGWSINTRVSAYRKWIHHHMNEKCLE